MPILFVKRYNPAMVAANTDKIFVFGDNDLRVGHGGQAQIRDFGNAIGVRTKKKPAMTEDAFYDRTPAGQVEAIKKITEDLDIVETFLKGGVTVVMPYDGLGAGRAQLDERCPVAFQYLCTRLSAMVETYGHSYEDGHWRDM